MDTLPNELHHQIVHHICGATITPTDSQTSQEHIFTLLHLSQADKHWHNIAAPVLKQSLNELVKAVRKAAWRNHTETHKQFGWLNEADSYLREIVKLPYCFRKWALCETLFDQPISLGQHVGIEPKLGLVPVPEDIDTKIDGGRSTTVQVKIDCSETRTFLAKGLELSETEGLIPMESITLMDAPDAQVMWISQVKLSGHGGEIRGGRCERGETALEGEESLDTYFATWWKNEDGAITLYVRFESVGKSQ